MKKILLLGLALGAICGAFVAGTRFAKLGTDVSDGRRVLYYVDPMNPAHTSDKPGLAPCGMKMVAVYAEAPAAGPAMGANTSVAAGTVMLSPQRQQLFGVRLGVVEKRQLDRSVRLLGKVAVDETRVYRLGATVDGWVTQVLPLAVGSRVKKDETLASFYSPEFLSAGQALLFALSSMDRVVASGAATAGQPNQVAQFKINLKQYEDSLKNLGMGDLQIQEMIKTRQYTENVNLVSPASGFVLARNLSKGQRFEKGTELFRIADLSVVWIIAEVFENEADLFKPGSQARFRLHNQGGNRTAIATDALPQFDPVSRSLKVRLEAENSDFALRPDMFVDIDAPLPSAERLLVPRDAIVDSGLRQTVFVASGTSAFEPRSVRLGAKFGDDVEIREGLMAGETVVVAGTFLLDSESRMKMAATDVTSVTFQDPVCRMQVDPQQASAAKRTSLYEGKTYYFCAEVCKQRFDKAPAQLIAKIRGSAGHEPGAGRNNALVNGITAAATPPTNSAHLRD